MNAVDAFDRARLSDVARLQTLHAAKGLSIDEKGELNSLVSVLLRRHAADDAGAQAAVRALLVQADEAETIIPPTISTIINAAASGAQGRETTRAAGGRR